MANGIQEKPYVFDFQSLRWVTREKAAEMRQQGLGAFEGDTVTLSRASRKASAASSAPAGGNSRGESPGAGSTADGGPDDTYDSGGCGPSARPSADHAWENSGNGSFPAGSYRGADSGCGWGSSGGAGGFAGPDGWYSYDEFH